MMVLTMIDQLYLERKRESSMKNVVKDIFKGFVVFSLIYSVQLYALTSEEKKSLKQTLKTLTLDYKDHLNASNIMLTIVNSKNGEVLVLVDVNDDPKKLFDVRVGKFLYEPGSVMKPIVLSLLLDKDLVSPSDMIDGHNGRYTIDNKVITDAYKFDTLSVEDVIVHSSNIGIAQLSQKLLAQDYHEGFVSFGFTQPSMPSEFNEKLGSIPQMRRLQKDIYKATFGYGYGMKVNLMQLVRAYNVFNNEGKILLEPAFVDGDIIWMVEEQIIKATTAQRMKKILIKTVQEGTATKAITKGLEIGGKTGTAHVVKDGLYVNKYNTSFVGFANDAQNKYTIGVLVKQPTKSQYASETAVPVFKKVVDIMIDQGLLKPKSEE